MPISDANPNLYESIHVLKEEEKIKMCHRLQLDYLLFPTKSDFIKLCQTATGDNRAGKIENLQLFDTDIFFVTKLNGDRCSDFNKKESICELIPYSSYATKRLYDLFHENLKNVCEESGIPPPIQKSSSIDNIHKNIIRMVVEAEIHDEDYLLPLKSPRPPDVLVKIAYAKSRYDITAANDAANDILEQILEIEQKNCADDLSDDQLVSNIESQIKLVEKLPIQQVELQLENLIKEITLQGLSHNRTLFGDVRERVACTCVAMKREIDAFLKTSTAKNEHELISDLDKTIDSLIEKAESFRKDWELEFSRFFTSDDQSNAKRQRID